MNHSQHFRNQLIAETRRRLMEEGVPRIKKCLAELSEAEIWYRPNEHSNSVGNLVLHLCGNVRQWLLSSLGGQADTRKRQSEFDERGPIPASALTQRLDEVMDEVEKLLEGLTTEQILQSYTVQGFQETGVSILVHVIEHFSYHVGQITYFVKWRKDREMGFYRGLNLDVTT
jgi:uncharacterized damage-inducible protein DinB